MTNDRRDRAVGSLLGLAVGDALGTTLEFAWRDRQPPLTDMIGGGPFCLQAGEWTDDTSMALCLAESLLADPRLDEADLMRRFLRWWEEGHNSVTGTCFDIGNTTSEALYRFRLDGNPRAGRTEPETAGNGSLMRLAPAVIRHHRDPVLAAHVARRQSATTHAAAEAVDACECFAGFLLDAIGGAGKHDVLAPRGYAGELAIAAIAAGRYRELEREQVSSSGYVVHTLEAALWCVHHSSGFREAVLLAANLGRDADTVAAVTGQLAGALWGAKGIPPAWIAMLAWEPRIRSLAEQLYDAGEEHQSNIHSR